MGELHKNLPGMMCCLIVKICEISKDSQIGNKTALLIANKK